MVVERPVYTRTMALTVALSSPGCLNRLSRHLPLGRKRISLPRHHLPRARTLIVMPREKAKAVASSIHGFAAFASPSILCSRRLRQSQFLMNDEVSQLATFHITLALVLCGAMLSDLL